MENALADGREYFFGRTNATVGATFHEALPLVEGIRVLTCKKDVSDWCRFVAKDGCEVARLVAGVAALDQRIGRPVLQMREERLLAVTDTRRGNQRTRKDFVEGRQPEPCLFFFFFRI